ncbi:hypothetical protein K491DRAFT_717183 [Lophiostoma macrostomum CBS 122681]|uniref:Uncharacterized protein n=1 Tax=Lophiostoma macrostomum CBS 122681 TaxID=1314788 RepID=A0A6A6T735_9PLEO|nr:hypothetical protein K491DRAFT_717183 [Lophiostoma macrostomum CBS 122681]
MNTPLKLHELELLEKYKGLIISQGRALYGSRVPEGHTFDVIMAQEDRSSDATVSIVVYTEPNSFAAWTSLAEVSCVDKLSACGRLLYTLKSKMVPVLSAKPAIDFKRD